MIRRLITCVVTVILLTLITAATDVLAVTPSARAVSDDNALQLLIIELFFLLIGLFVMAVLGYLIWKSRHKKNEKEKQGKR